MIKQNPNKKKINDIFVYTLAGALILFFALIVILKSTESHAEDNTVTVYKSPTCGCCKKWISHLEDNGFKVKAVDINNLSNVKNMAGIPAGAGSCHTAFIDDYVIEGHVPANDIKQLLTEKRDVVGLTVPGMPMGSPGMEGHRVDKYSVYEFGKEGKLNEVSRY